MVLVLDAKAKAKVKPKPSTEFLRGKQTELQYATRMRKIARGVGDLVGAFPPGDPLGLPRLSDLLNQYAKLIQPFAEAMAGAMLAEVARKDQRQWAALSASMGRALKGELASDPTGVTLRRLQGEQIKLITSIPIDAAKRVHTLTMEGLSSAARMDEVIADIRRTTHVTESRATLIARTEVGRATTNLAQARAEVVGSDGYIWRTAEDSAVRPSHRKMEGKLIKWSRPPTLDNLTGHAGCLPNCRCYPEIVLPRSY